MTDHITDHITKHIKVGDIAPRIQYTGDGRETAFPFPFPVFAEADLTVWLGDREQTLATDYTVRGSGADRGGTVTFRTPPASGMPVTLVRHLTIERTSDFQESGEFRARVINDELDRLVAMVQQNALAIARSVQLAVTDDTDGMVMPSRTARANTYLAFDGDGAPVGAANPGSYPASSFMARLLGVADAAAARAVLGALSVNGDGSRLSGVARDGGPAIGPRSLYRTNAKNTRADVTLADHTTTFTVDPAAGTLDVGADHGFLEGDPVYLTTTGSLPRGLPGGMSGGLPGGMSGGLSAGTGYYVREVTDTAVRLSATYGGPVLDITDTGEGIHTVYEAINAMTIGPNTVEDGVTVTVPEGSVLTVVGG